jgi:hypothetical protein
MLSAVLAIFVAGVGVGFGWQPLPGHSGESELVVQVDPRALERLAEGASIPLTADVPAEAGRVARIRLTVGGAPLSTRREVTRLKPIGEPSTLTLTQYTEQETPRYGATAPNYNTPNYGAPPNAAQPLATTPTPQTFDPYTQAPPSAAATTAWNTNSDAVTGSLQRIGSDIQTAAQPLQDGVERVGDSVRQLGNNIAGRADQLRDSLGRPIQNGLLGGTSGTATTPAATTGDPGVASQWNGAPSLPVTPPPTTPPLNMPPAAASNDVAGGAGSNWNVETSPTPGVGGAMGTGGGTSTAPPYAGGSNGPVASATDASRWTNVNDSQPRAGAGLGSAAPSTIGGNFGSPGGFGNPGATGNTLSLPDPPSLTNASGGFGQSGPLLAPPSGDSGDRAVNRNMLALPGDRALEGPPPGGTLGTMAGAASPGSPFSNVGAAVQPGVGAATPPGASMLGSQSWATGQPPAGTPSGAAPGAALDQLVAMTQELDRKYQPDGKQQAAVILAWVLLFASVAGNMYLFWSYLDVRTKYRALVRKTARAVGSRFSAA